MTRALPSVLAEMGACREAVAWVGTRTLTEAWAQCERADWMLWLAAKVLDRKLLVLAACACARTALVHVPPGEDRPLRAIETAERWARGEATEEEVGVAVDDAYAAYAAAAAAYAAAHAADAAYAAAYATAYATDAVHAAAHAAYAAYAAAHAAYAAAAAHAAHATYAAYAAYAAAHAAYAAAYAATRAASLRSQADLVRREIPVEVIVAAMEAK
jgi:hypothetical protein